MNTPIFSQHPYRCKLDWGQRGARQAAERGDIIVIVDTLSFSTAVACAVHHGGIVYPCSKTEDVAAFAQRISGEASVNRRDVPDKGRFSLSPLTYLGLESGTRIVLASPNGATCSRLSGQVSYLFTGALVNAAAVATAVSQVMSTTNLSVTVIACGEQWSIPSSEGQLRVAIEDYVGAGAILSYLEYEKSPEARVCEGSFRYIQKHLEETLWECGSARELRESGFEADVQHSLTLNLYDSVPVMRGEYFEKAYFKIN
ncbi:2-phosphosulfolactate phosphatase [Funiculus sociatus GB2-A5]|uniref:Probable 2-phosphosulfolactate phosphatase n=1 Tax=Funiculus sociatus GB2-A5 TaxID=2933946 RepID=A0ABV0JPG3_9CYAN|nr:MULTISPECIES: 2-phosphosulfolactate phosphatase [unclassified Trichocoleus]MBD1904278.1 2-phosphosulfolactate phosphatase [Trichocoleus sp. FACHB-832]MBD2064183.1 2-phosphosulfolactate phosphatase [Trichocoleus sp. FACHB-6]